MAALYQDAYPIKFKAMAMVDAPLMVWAMMKLVSLFIKKKLRDRLNEIIEVEELQARHRRQRRRERRQAGVADPVEAEAERLQRTERRQRLREPRLRPCALRVAASGARRAAPRRDAAHVAVGGADSFR